MKSILPSWHGQQCIPSILSKDTSLQASLQACSLEAVYRSINKLLLQLPWQASPGNQATVKQLHYLHTGSALARSKQGVDLSGVQTDVDKRVVGEAYKLQGSSAG